MVTTRGTRRASGSIESFGEEEGAENALTEMQTSDSPVAKMEESVAGVEVETKVEVPVEEARNDQCDEKNGKIHGGENKMEKIENGDESATLTQTNGDNVPESEQNTSEDDELDDQDGMWEDDYDSEDIEEDEGSEDYEIQEQDDEVEEQDDDDEGEEEDEDGDGDGKEEIGEEAYEAIAVKQEGATAEGDQDKTKDGKEIMKVDGGDNEEKKNKKSGDNEEKNNMKSGDNEEKKNKKSGDNEEKKNKKTNLSLKISETPSKRSTKEKAPKQKKVSSRDKPESSNRGKATKRVQTMGMIFMCSSKTKDDCYKYKVLGLPESKKDLVEKIYSGMRLFLYDVDLKLLYGIYKAKGPGGYNIQPKAFKSQYPAQVRFTILKDCLPLAEEKFKKVIKDNYFTKTKFDCVLKSEQVRKLCKMFLVSNRGPKPTKLSKSHEAEKLPRSRKAEDRHMERRGKSPRQKVGDKRRVALRGDRERPRKRPREVISAIVPVHRPLPMPVSPRGPYLESRIPFNDRRISHRDSYRDGRYSPTEYDDYYRDGRAYVGRGYRDGLDDIVRSDPFRDVRDPYSEYRDPYPETRGQGLYIEPRDLYRNERDPYTRGRDLYRDGQDSALYRRDLYRDVAYPDPYGGTYKREGPLSDRHEVYRREEVLGRHVPPLEITRRNIVVGSQDPYAAYHPRTAYADHPIYSSDYPPRGSASASAIARQYRL